MRLRDAYLFFCFLLLVGVNHRLGWLIIVGVAGLLATPVVSVAILVWQILGDE